MNLTTTQSTAGDPYPSRGKVARWLERRDPVVWEGVDGPLTAADLERYEREGFLAFPAMLGEAEVRSLLEQSHRRRDAADPAAPTTILEPEGDAVRSVFQPHLSPLFGRLMRDPRFLGAARQILGGDVYVHQSRINFKPGFEGQEFYWHSDFETWHMEDGMPRMRCFSCVVTLSETNEHNGPLMLMPGSHQTYVSCAGETPEKNFETSLRRQTVGVPDHDSLTRLADEHGIVAPTGPAGSVIFFDCNLMHGSNGNITPFPRNNLFFVYNSVDNRLTAPFCGLPPRPEHIATRETFERLTLPS